MRRLKSIETDEVALEVVECDCGFHLGIDATFLDQVGEVSIVCPSCGIRIDSVDIFEENRI